MVNAIITYQQPADGPDTGEDHEIFDNVLGIIGLALLSCSLVLKVIDSSCTIKAVVWSSNVVV